ncbi:GHMP family kinase ATP-binding protein [Cloacibacillus sp.]
MTIQVNCDEIMGDSLDVEGMPIMGENLVTKALLTARKYTAGIPPLKIRLKKFFPAGSGIGAGSGNAAALLGWLRENFALKMTAEQIGKLGADVAFLASGSEIAEARGVGELLTPAGEAPKLGWILAFPKWGSNTKEAYAKLDAMRDDAGGYYAPTAEEIAKESAEYLEKLQNRRCNGRLPNDFFPVLAAEHREYGIAEEIAAATGACGWGLCGSGSAFFGLYDSSEAARGAEKIYDNENWILKTFYLE